jgi:hypothetical protein
MLSQTLAATQAAQSAESTAAQSDTVIKAAHSAKYSLMAAIAATQGNTALPNLDVIARNHKSWMETAKQMGIVAKSKCLCPAEDSGLTAQCIGVVKGKHHRIHNDPYARGERSGKRTKPNAPSPANVAPPTVESTPGITLLGPATIPPPTSVPRIAPLGVPIPAQVDTFAPPPTCIPRLMPPGVPIPAQGDVFAHPPTCVPRITPPGVAIPVQGDAFVHPPTHAPGIAPPGPMFTTLLQALAFYTAAPPSKFTTST